MHSLRLAAQSTRLARRAFASRLLSSPAQPAIARCVGRERSGLIASQVLVARPFSQSFASLDAAESRLDGESPEHSETSALDQDGANGGAVEQTELPDSGTAHAGNVPKPEQEPEPPNGIFVRNMTFDTTDAHLKEHFERYGNVVKVAVNRDGRGLSRGWGFVWFDTPEAAETAKQEVSGSFWNGRRIQVLPRTHATTRTRTETEPTNSLYVGNIPYETTDAELNRLFRDLDDVHDVRVAVDRTTGWPRGFAHADFFTSDAAAKARENLLGITLGGRKLRVDFAQPVDARRGKRRGSN